MRHLVRRYSLELGFLLLVGCWFGVSGFQGEVQSPARGAGEIGVSLAGLGILIRAIAPLLRRGESGVDREDVRWQEQTSAAIQGLTLSIRDWAEEQRRHNQQVELLMCQSIIPRIGDPT